MCCNGFKIGMLKHKVIIERNAEVSDGAGGTTTTWATHKTLRANVKPTSGKERMFAQRLESNTTHLVTIRYISDISESDRINYKGRIFNIYSIINMDEADKYLQLVCEENVAT